MTQAPRFCGGPAALSGARQVRRGAPHDLDASQFFGTWPCSARISTRMERDSKRIRAIVTRRRVTVPVPERSINRRRVEGGEQASTPAQMTTNLQTH